MNLEIAIPAAERPAGLPGLFRLTKRRIAFRLACFRYPPAEFAGNEDTPPLRPRMQTRGISEIGMKFVVPKCPGFLMAIPRPFTDIFIGIIAAAS